MRSVQKLEIKVGLLVVAGIFSVVAMVMMSDRISFERYYPIDVFLPDAGGLRLSSPVTLSGIAIGEVAAIEPAPAGSMAAIRARLKIKRSQVVPAGSTVQLATSGLFGDSSLAFSVDPVAAATGRVLPTDGSAKLLANPAFLDEASAMAKGLLKGLNNTLDAQAQADIKRLLANAADLAGEGAALAKGLNAQQAKLGELLTNLGTISADLGKRTESIAARLDQVLARTEQTLATVEEKGGRLLDGADQAVRGADSILAANAADLRLLVGNLAALSATAGRIAEAIDAGDGVAGRLIHDRQLADQLADIAVDLSVVSRRLVDDPSTVVWGKSNAQEREDQSARARLKAQRRMAEGVPAP